MLDARETEIFELELESSEPEILPYFGKEVEDNAVQLSHEVTIENKVEDHNNVTLVQNNLIADNFLNKPSNIYSNSNTELSEELNETEKVDFVTPENTFELTIKNDSEIEEIISEEEDAFEMTFEVKNKEVVNEVKAVESFIIGELSEEEEQRKRAVDRIQKLRNLSFNMSNSEDNSEFDNVPAYVRRNMELFGNTLATVEDFYSKVTVDKNDKNETFISTKNSFLDGQRPD